MYIVVVFAVNLLRVKTIANIYIIISRREICLIYIQDGRRYDHKTVSTPPVNVARTGRANH